MVPLLFIVLIGLSFIGLRQAWARYVQQKKERTKQRAANETFRDLRTEFYLSKRKSREPHD